MPFVKATKKQAKGRIALIGISGSGKTWTSLSWARVLAGREGRIAVIDTENHSASKYADTHDFDTLDLESFSPKSYCDAIHEAEKADYDALVIDSLSHAWVGKDGVLAMVDAATTRARSSNAFTTGWREVTPEHNKLVDALVRCRCHLIVTMRAKTAYEIEDVNGKKIPRKIGLSPIQRDGMEYEFDLVGDMDDQHRLIVSKSRCKTLDKLVAPEPGQEVFRKFQDWLTDGVPVEQPAPIVLASSQQVREMKELLNLVRLPDDTIDRWFTKAGIEVWEDMSADTITKCIEYTRNRLPATATASVA
jgi:ABC-type dipeptide/oligopeptide/nickel transport system ATPase component